VLELFKPLKDSTSLLRKKTSLVFCFKFFASDTIGGIVLGLFGPLHLAGTKPPDGSILLKFLLETRLKSESFKTLDILLGFGVQRLKNKKVS